jgi:hypothetical protein
MLKELITKFEGTQGRLTKKKIVVIAVHAFIGWALCTATMVISMATTSIENALILHAAGAPIIFTAVSLSYFRKYNYTSPIKTGLIFVGFVIFMDFFVVSMLVLKNFEMFASLLGTWIPFALIFTSTFVTGLLINRSSKK